MSGRDEKEGEREREKKQNPLLEGLEGSSDHWVSSSTAEKLDDSACKIALTGEDGPLLGNHRDDDRLRLIRYILHHPEGAPISQIWRDVFGKTGPADPGDSDYQFARRFYTENDEYFDTFDQNGMTQVEFTLSLMDLIGEGIVQKSDSGPSTDRGICRSLLSSVRSLNSDGKDLLAREIERYVNRINDWRLVFRVIDPKTGRSKRFLKPYKTRFNDLGRIKQQWARYHDALDHARDEFDNAALVTLTSDPKQFAHLLEATDSITSNFNRLMSWMGYDCKQKETSRPGYRPDFIRVLEFTEDGKPHLHILFFGVPTRADGTPWLIDKDELSRKWDSLGQGRIVDVQGLVHRDDLGDCYDADAGFVSISESDRLDQNAPPPLTDGGSSSGVGAGQTAGQYLGKYLSGVFGGLPAGSADDNKADAYKIALYWATGKRIWSCSKEIEQAIEPEEDESDTRVIVEYVGAYPYWDLPAGLISESRPMAEFEAAVWNGRWPDISTHEAGDRPPPSTGVIGADTSPQELNL